jgi:hypothetical protein
MTKEDLIGTWKLKSFVVTSRDGSKKDWGRAHGTLIYNEQGVMSAAINGEDLKDQVFYSGTFSIKGNIVVHKVTEAHRPIRIGTEQERKATLLGNQLTLEAFGPESTATIEWERYHPGKRA